MTSLFINQQRAAKKAQRLVNWVLFLIVSVIVWAVFSPLDEVIVGEGKVVPAQAIQSVENLDGGTLKAILVKEGEPVEQGQALVYVDETRFAAALAESHHEQATLKATIYRLEHELASIDVDDDSDKTILINLQQFSVKGLSDVLTLQTNRTYNARMAQLISMTKQTERTIEQQQQAINEQKANIASLKLRLDLIKKEVKMTADVFKMGAVGELELIKLQREEVTLQGDINRSNASMLQFTAAKQQAIEEQRNIAFDFIASARAELGESRNALAKINESIKSLSDRVNKAQIRSPVDGTVKNIMVRSIGAVIEPGQAIMEIVPRDDKLIIETRIAPKDIGFIRVGMRAKVKFTAYDFVIYGGLAGDVVYVGADVQQLEDGTPYYEAHIKTDKNILASQPIISGMQASVDILTGKKTVLQYWLKPLLRAKANAMREP
jgi:adhesin transport system membrane fusion protein